MMSKGKIYTLITFLISFCVVIGGWFLTKRMLNQREKNFLNGAGQIALRQSEYALLEESEYNITIEETTDKNEFNGRDLSETMMEMILNVWESGGYKLPCEPEEDQMNMEQAVIEGRDWIASLAEKGILPSYLGNCIFGKTDAVLYTLDVDVSFRKALLDVWEITYTDGDVKITLTIHAVSGQVWKADIFMDADKMIYKGCSDEELLKTAFPMIGDEVGSTQKDQVIYISFSEGKVFAALKRSEIKINKEQETARLMLWLCAG